MTMRYTTRPVGRSVMQAGIPTTTPSDAAPSAMGLHLRGVVTATYTTDEDGAPNWREDRAQLGVFCDVLAYSTLANLRFIKLPAVPVLQDRGGMHSGRVWKPRATTVDVAEGSTPDFDKSSNPANWDGDHVLIGFVDNNLNFPIILGGVSHPSVDVGNGDNDIGHRKRLKLADGDPDFFRHHGSYYGIADNGDHVVDTTRANDGTLNPDGTEPGPPTDGKGSQYRRAQQAAEISDELYDMSGASPATFAAARLWENLYEVLLDGVKAAMKVEGGDGDATLTVGDGGGTAKHAAVFEHLETWWNGTIKPLLTAFDAHTHASAMGPTGPPVPIIGAPDLATNVKSTKVIFPDG